MHFSYRLIGDTELRLLEPRYADDLFALVDRNREHLRRMSWIDHIRSVEDIRTYIRHAQQGMANGNEVHWGIWHGGHFAGIIGTHPLHWQDHRGEFGYWVGEEFQGKGLVTVAGQAMTAYLFNSLNLHRLEFHIRTNNQRSLAVAQRLGFSKEGVQRRAAWSLGEWIDIECYGLLREEWEGSAASITFAYPLTEDAELRLLLPHYAEEVFAVTDRNRAYLRPWMPWADTTTEIAHSREFIQHALQWLADGSSVQWGIWYRGQYAGGIGTVYIDHTNKKTEIGYWIAEEHQGNGLVTMAARAMLKYLFTTLDMRRVEIHFRATNARSRAVAARLGFVQEGVLRQVSLHDGHPADAVITALLREEWEAQQDPGAITGQNTADCRSRAS